LASRKRGRGPTRLQRVGGLITGVLVIWGGVMVTTVYAHYWQRMRHLPAIVARLDASHGTRPVPLSQISPWLPKALIATEDRTFYTNLGISTRGVLRALWTDLVSGRPVEGGSTLTQQLVRDRLLGLEKTFKRKLEEALLSFLATALYSKREILTLYLNQVYLGQGAYGVAAASRIYFGRTPRELSLAQASLLAGLPQAPSAYDPFVHLSAARRRQWEVLESMVQDHMISLSVARATYGAPLGLAR
jgi:membrane peptidoglycan carboxypeptidase